MAEESAAQLSPQQLIAKHRRTYFIIGVTLVTIGAGTMTIAAQFFMERQALAMIGAVLGFDLFRSALLVALYEPSDADAGHPDNKSLLSFFWASTPRRWAEYALLALPANAALTYIVLGGSIADVQNVGTYTINILTDVVGLVVGEVSDLTAGLASLVFDFGIVGLLEYIAARWLFSKRKLIFKKKA